MSGDASGEKDQAVEPEPEVAAGPEAPIPDEPIPDEPVESSPGTASAEEAPVSVEAAEIQPRTAPEEEEPAEAVETPQERSGFDGLTSAAELEKSGAAPAVQGDSIPPGAVTPARRPPRKRSALRDFLSTAQRMMALGLLVVIGSAIVNWAVAFRIVMPLALRHGSFLGEGIHHTLLRALLAQVGVIIVLPALCWCLAWIIQERPFRLAIGAAIFAELWQVVITVMSGGVGSLVAEPVFMAARYVYLLLAGVLGGFAYCHARRMADRKFPPGGG